MVTTCAIALSASTASFSYAATVEQPSILSERGPAVALGNRLSSHSGDISALLSSERSLVRPSSAAAMVAALALLLASGAISWSAFKHVQQQAHQQQWQRQEFLRQTMREFEQDPEIRNALKILDFEEYRNYTIAAKPGQAAITFRVTDKLLCNALANHDERARRKHQLDIHQDHNRLDPAAFEQYAIETALRDWFNKMLNGMEHFGYFLESGLCSDTELQPWINYWIKLIGDPAYRRPGASKFYNALYSYIHHSGFFGVQKLFDRFGYRILPSPYQDADFVGLSVTTTYDGQLALSLAKAAYLAYQDKQFVAEIVGRWGAASLPTQETRQTPTRRQTQQDFIKHNFRYFNNKGRDTQAYLFRTPTLMVLAFRGSQQPKDWLTNVTTQLRNFTIRKGGVTTLSSYKGRVHTGFFLAWSIIEHSVLAQIERWQAELTARGESLPPLYITGHSLGGALATMAAAALSDNGIEVAGVYTFGQPRVGDRTFVSQLNTHTYGKVFRFVNNNDIVPHVPPPFSMWNPTRLYGHVGMAKYFNAKGAIIATYPLAARLTDISLGLVKGALGAGFDLISDHRMEYYISHLESALQNQIEAEATHWLEEHK